MMTPIFITGIGTDIGKTIVSAIITEALQADYWKPVQAGFNDGTDALRIKDLLSNSFSKIHPETYKLKMPASPHIAAREEGEVIRIEKIKSAFSRLQSENPYLIIEGAGGLMVPINEKEFIVDIIKELNAKVILVSRNYLGSINHSLLTAAACRQYNIEVLGWVFNDLYLDYEEDIVRWTGIPSLGSIPLLHNTDRNAIYLQSQKIRTKLLASI